MTNFSKKLFAIKVKMLPKPILPLKARVQGSVDIVTIFPYFFGRCSYDKFVLRGFSMIVTYV